jgi:isopentenyl-diphosphate delta-isomerase
MQWQPPSDNHRKKMEKNDIRVSFDDEELIVVDKKDNIVDYKTKAKCHEGDGILHRAFSIFIFNDQKQLLLQKRSESKLLWPLYWSNSCCSHPRKSESMGSAATRRLTQEMGIQAALQYLYKFEYHARYKNIGSEWEICSVFIGKSDETVHVNRNEISDWKFVNLKILNEELHTTPNKFTPWFKMEWERIKSDYRNKIELL